MPLTHQVNAMADALIIDTCRTPRGIGKAGKGALSGIHPQQLGATVLRALADRTGINTRDVDDIIWGTSAQVSQQGGDLGRMSALDAGYDVRASGVTLDRFCGSGITSVNMAAASIMAGLEDLVVAGGTEMMSMEGRRGQSPMLMDAGNLRLRARHPQSHQGVCADAIATMERRTSDCTGRPQGAAPLAPRADSQDSRLAGRSCWARSAADDDHRRSARCGLSRRPAVRCCEGTQGSVWFGQDHRPKGRTGSQTWCCQHFWIRRLVRHAARHGRGGGL